MIVGCSYCSLDTAGQHESNCLLNPDNQKSEQCKNCLMRIFYPNALCGDTSRDLAHKDEE